jgi:hypothetical protein
MTDLQFYAFWGACFGFMLLFLAFIGVLELMQRKKDREDERKADEQRQEYSKKQADRKRWEESWKESEKLFEEVDG